MQLYVPGLVAGEAHAKRLGKTAACWISLDVAGKGKWCPEEDSRSAVKRLTFHAF